MGDVNELFIDCLSVWPLCCSQLLSAASRLLQASDDDHPTAQPALCRYAFAQPKHGKQCAESRLATPQKGYAGGTAPFDSVVLGEERKQSASKDEVNHAIQQTISS